MDETILQEGAGARREQIRAIIARSIFDRCLHSSPLLSGGLNSFGAVTAPCKGYNTLKASVNPSLGGVRFVTGRPADCNPFIDGADESAKGILKMFFRCSVFEWNLYPALTGMMACQLAVYALGSVVFRRH
jgi:hypothetical protein